ncbi:MAG: hypothetical protein KGD70_12035 [Candidatus Lokiarchaeota archaeon]|nr:hypothetical protein [Candidatus Lokiarchaeota archaeon]
MELKCKQCGKTIANIASFKLLTLKNHRITCICGTEYIVNKEKNGEIKIEEIEFLIDTFFN